MIVAEPAARGGNVQPEQLLLGGVDRCVADSEFGLGQASCGEKPVTCRDVLPLAGLSPAGEAMQSTVRPQSAAFKNKTLSHFVNSK